MAIPPGRSLSAAELAGWRRYWDGWCICAQCVVLELRRRKRETWGVPADYDTAIGPEARCMHCKRSPATVAEAMAGEAAAAVEMIGAAIWRRLDRCCHV